MMAGVVMAVVDRRHAMVEHGGEVELVRYRCDPGANEPVRSWCDLSGAA